MIKKVFRPAVYNDYDPIFIKKALVKSNEIYKGGLTVKQIDDVYDTILATLNNWPEDEASVEKINDLVIAALREKKFIKLSDMYAMHKSKMQNISSTSIKLSEKLGEVSKETDRSNANVGNNFSGKLLQLASEASK
jgi:ribonucleoside-triphosphate reductase